MTALTMNDRPESRAFRAEILAPRADDNAKPDRRARLERFLKDALAKVIVGVNDCGPWAALWVRAECGKRVVIPAYTSRAQGLRRVARGGGFAAYAQSLVDGVGLARTEAPVLGDAGIVRIGDKVTAAIFTAHGYAAARRDDFGYRVFHPDEVLIAWRVEETAWA